MGLRQHQVEVWRPPTLGVCHPSRSLGDRNLDHSPGHSRHHHGDEARMGCCSRHRGAARDSQHSPRRGSERRAGRIRRGGYQPIAGPVSGVGVLVRSSCPDLQQRGCSTGRWGMGIYAGGDLALRACPSSVDVGHRDGRQAGSPDAKGAPVRAFCRGRLSDPLGRRGFGRCCCSSLRLKLKC